MFVMIVLNWYIPINQLSWGETIVWYVIQVFSEAGYNWKLSFFAGRIIGKGGSSCVYKGCADSQELAVKILKLSEENIKEFISEIEILGELQNDNIISLVGFCFENDSLILAYEHLPRGSLEEILHGES
jgi:predicted Ser/Thr protein kinase